MVTQSSMIGCSTPTWRNHFGSEILFWAWVSGFNSLLVRTFSYQSQEKSLSISTNMVVSNVLFLNIEQLSFSEVEKIRYLPVCKLKSGLHHYWEYLPHKRLGAVEVEVMPWNKLGYYVSNMSVWYISVSYQHPVTESPAAHPVKCGLIISFPPVIHIPVL